MLAPKERNASLLPKKGKRGVPRNLRNRNLSLATGVRPHATDRSSSSGITIPGNKLHVGDIPLHFTEEDIYRIFSKFGEVKDVNLLKKNNGKGLSKVVCNLSEINIAASLS